MAYENIDVDLDPSLASNPEAAWFRGLLSRVLDALGQSPKVGLTLLVTTDERVHDLNLRYRQVDAPTDVLSFPAGEDAAFVTPEGLPPYLGDIVISWPTVRRQAAEHAHDVEDELALLVVHGVLHLLGYDHQGAKDQRVMWAKQADILAGLGIEVPSDL